MNEKYEPWFSCLRCLFVLTYATPACSRTQELQWRALKIKTETAARARIEKVVDQSLNNPNAAALELLERHPGWSRLTR